jgi:hypothetical protein
MHADNLVLTSISINGYCTRRTFIFTPKHLVVMTTDMIHWMILYLATRYHKYSNDSAGVPTRTSHYGTLAVIR